MALKQKTKKNRYKSSFNSIISDCSGILEINDSSTFTFDVDFLLPNKNVDPRQKNGLLARLYTQFENLNRPFFKHLDVTTFQHYDGSNVWLKLNSGIKVGAVPLISPSTYKPDYSLIIKPRFGWNGIGPVLSNIGWKIIPQILDLPQLKISEKRIPSWVLSAVVLDRIYNMLKTINRGFEYTENDVLSPKGQIDWQDYSCKKISNANFINFKCRYPELFDDAEIKSAIHYTLLKQLQSLNTERESGFHVFQLIDFCLSLIQQVKDRAPNRPKENFFSHFRTTLNSRTLLDGLQAIDWTVNEKGLAGKGEFHGIPWFMSMETLFETYIEAIAQKLVSQSGGKLKVGRNRETITPINWQPNFLGSQRFLLPDIIIEKEDHQIIIDAKYKEHWEDLNIDGWYNIEETIRERHRVDLFQILSYSSFVESNNITACLIYPCKYETYTSLISRNRLYHQATITNGKRTINLKLTAIPFDIKKEEAVSNLLRVIYN